MQCPPLALRIVSPPPTLGSISRSTVSTPKLVVYNIIYKLTFIILVPVCDLQMLGINPYQGYVGKTVDQLSRKIVRTMRATGDVTPTYKRHVALLVSCCPFSEQ